MQQRATAGAGTRPIGVTPPTETLWSIQVMRGLAALMIIVGHGQGAVAQVLRESGRTFARVDLMPWGSGVDLFFVISGFIMVHATKNLFGRPDARAEFLRRRLGRIIPLYWIMTSAFILLLAAAAYKGGDAFPGPVAILASYAFIPFDTYGTGRLFPVYDLGWTLNYEMFFYAIFALIVAWPRTRALIALAVAIIVLTLIGIVVPGPSALWFWTRPILLDFGLGVGVGVLMTAGIRLPPVARIVLATASLVLVAADPWHVFAVPVGTTVANEWPRVIVAGIPTAAILGAAVLGPHPRMPGVMLPFARLGDASYSLYLLHPFALILMEKLAQKSAIVHALPGWLLMAGTLVIAILLAAASYTWLERPITRAIGNRMRASRRFPLPVPATD